MIFLDIDNNFSKGIVNNVNDSLLHTMSVEERMQLLAKATLDRRLNARDLKLYNYIIFYEYLGYTQEQISELLDLSRSNINKSLEKLASFSYIEKKEVKVESENKKRMLYAPNVLSRAGIINCNEHDIIRVLNVSNVSDAKLKYIYCSQQDYREYELSIKGYEADIDTIERCYNSEHEHTRNKAYVLIKLFSMIEDKDDAIKSIKERIKEIKTKLKDTKSMKNKLIQFSRNLKSNVLDEKAVQEVLANEDAKLILFLDRSERDNFKNFKEKYLEDYIRFVCSFTDLAKNEDFFKLYYENKKIEMSLTEIIRLLGYNHREVPHMRKYATDSIMKSFKNFLDTAKKLEFPEEVKAFIDEIEELYDNGLASDGVYNAREVAIILYVLDNRKCIENIGLSYDAFVGLYNSGLLNTIAEVEKINPVLFETILANVRAEIEAEKAKRKAEKAKKDDEIKEEIKGEELIELLESQLDTK